MNKADVIMSQIKLYVQSIFPTFKEDKDWKSIIFSMFIAFIISVLFKDTIFEEKESTGVAILAITISCIWVGIMNSVLKICSERSAIKTAQKSGLFISAYIIGHIVYQLFLCLIQALVMVIVYGLMLNSPHKSPLTGKYNIDLFLNLFMILFASAMLGLVISSLSKSTISAIKIGTFILMLEIVLSGNVFTMSGAVEKASDLMIGKWGERALGVTVNMNSIPSNLLKYKREMIENVDGIDELLKVLPEEVIQKSKLGMDKFLYYNTYEKRYQYKKEFILERWLYLLGFAVCYAIIAGLLLKYIDYDKRFKLFRRKRKRS